MNRLRQRVQGYSLLHHTPLNAPASIGRRMSQCRASLKDGLVRHGLLTSRQQKHDRQVARQQDLFKRVADILNGYGGGSALQAVAVDAKLRYAVAPKPFKQSRPADGRAPQTTWVGLEIRDDGQVAPYLKSLAVGQMPAQLNVCNSPDFDESGKENLAAELRSLVISDAFSEIGF